MYTRSFDSEGRLKTHRIGSDTRTLTYDAASRITQTTDTNPMNNRTYDYDALDRLISQADNSGFKLWGYDANSNRTTAQFGGTGYPRKKKRKKKGADPFNSQCVGYVRVRFGVIDGCRELSRSIPGGGAIA